MKLCTRFALIAAAAAIGLLSSSPAMAIKNGELDGDWHPGVGLMVFDVDGEPEWRCSGTLISPTIMLTAGHCTFGATGGRVWFESDVQAGIPENGYPYGGPTSIEFAEIHTHPDYDDDFFWLADVAVVELSQPVYLDSYPELPEIGLLDVFKTQRGHHDIWFTSVGYGLQLSNPNFVEANRVRMVAFPRLISLASPSDQFAGTVLVSSNPVTGGGCYGDSGGPSFLADTNIIVGVDSYTMGTNCDGAGGFYRLDSVDALSFIYSFLQP